MAWLAEILDRTLVLYGRGIPYHPKKLRIVSALDKLARRAWTGPRTARFHGVQYEFDPRSWVARSIYYLGDWEHWDTLYFNRTIKPGWTVIDVGSNLGYYALLASHLAGPQGEVFAFEPTPSTYKALLRNIALNAARNIKPCQAALADACGTVSIIENAQDDYNRIGGRDENQGCQVPCLTLDYFAEKEGIRKVDLIKVDVEGAEHKLLLGARKTIDRFRPIVVIEANPLTLDTFGASVGDLIGELEGYDFYRANWRGFGALKAIPKPGKSFNVIALPGHP